MAALAAQLQALGCEVKTKQYINDSGECSAFGFPNSLVAKRGVRDILNGIPGAEIEIFSKDMFVEEFCTFKYKGRKFTDVEPSATTAITMQFVKHRIPMNLRKCVPVANSSL